MNDLKITVTDESVTVGTMTIPHNEQPWRSATNRHPNTDGTPWGWIDGAPGHVCWSNNERFNREAASAAVRAHNQWLDECQPRPIKIIKAKREYEKALADFNKINSQHSEALEIARNGYASMRATGAPCLAGFTERAIELLDAALAAQPATVEQPEKQGVPSIDALAQEIRRVDDNHSLGAGALAEALMPFLNATQPATVAQDGCDGTVGRCPNECSSPCDPTLRAAPDAQGDERAAFEAEYPAEYLAMKQKRAPFDVTEFAFAIWQRARAALARQQGGGDAGWQGLSQVEKAKFVADISDYGTGFVSPLFSVVESIENRLRELNDRAQRADKGAS